VKQKLVETGRERERVMPKKFKQLLDAEEALRKVNQKSVLYCRAGIAASWQQ